MAIFSRKRYFYDILMICTKINGHTENIKIYWYKKYQYIEKKVSCWNTFSVFRSDIETV
jgi:hypothetical protein